LSLAIAVLIAFGAWRIVRESVNMLLEGTPREIDLAELTSEIAHTERVVSMHDLHVWALSSDETALSVHVVVEDGPLGEAEHVVRDLEQRLCGRFAIGHTTIQVESCHPCGEITTERASTTTRTSTWSSAQQHALALKDPPSHRDSRRVGRIHPSVAEPARPERASLRVGRIGCVMDDAQVEVEAAPC